MSLKSRLLKLEAKNDSWAAVSDGELDRGIDLLARLHRGGKLTDDEAAELDRIEAKCPPIDGIGAHDEAEIDREIDRLLSEA
jgi:hypothetical protein